MIKKIFNAAIGISLLFGMNTIYAQIPIQQVPAQVNNMEFPYAPGQYTWPYAGGQLVLVSGRYTNQVSWDVRSYMFYFKNKEDLFLVPIENPNKKNPFEWINITTSGNGDYLTLDYLVTVKGKKIYLLEANQPWGFETEIQDRNDLTINTYEFVTTEQDMPFKFIFRNKKLYKHISRVSVEKYLLREEKLLRKE